jgi:hypothetical protein
VPNILGVYRDPHKGGMAKKDVLRKPGDQPAPKRGRLRGVKRTGEEQKKRN